MEVTKKEVREEIKDVKGPEIDSAIIAQVSNESRFTTSILGKLPAP